VGHWLLKPSICEGFTIDDERLKNPPGKGQRDYLTSFSIPHPRIRSSERRFLSEGTGYHATRWTNAGMRETTQQFFGTVPEQDALGGHAIQPLRSIAGRVDRDKAIHWGLQTTRPQRQIVRKR